MADEFLNIPKISTSIAKVILRHRTGLKAVLTNYGATLARLQFPDKFGNLQDLVAGYDEPKLYSLPPYTDFRLCLGASIGRYAGRISKGGFSLGDKFYDLSNDEGVHLHGGSEGFDKQLWAIKEVHHGEEPYVVFRLLSPEGQGGYPGTLEVEACYRLTEDSLYITYTATSDQTSIVNLTNHAYFHLDGEGTMKGNELFINSPAVLEVDKRLLPTGAFSLVESTPYDYRNSSELTFEEHNGLDTPFKLGKGKLAASLYSEISGIRMEVETNQPCLVVFTPQKFPKLGLRQEHNYGRFPAICFECQNFPDAPNHQNFPSAIVQPGGTYQNEIRYRFTIP